MLQTLHKLVLTGLGAVDLTEEKLRGVFDDLIKRGELTEKEACAMAAGFVKRADEQRAKLRALVEGHVHRLLERRGLAKKEDLSVLEDRVKALEHKATAWEKVDPEC